MPGGRVETTAPERSVRRALMDRVAGHPQGVAVEELRHAQGVEIDRAIAVGLAEGWLEPSTVYRERLCWAWTDEGDPEAAACVRLRRYARDVLASIHLESGLPVTLHVLVGTAHAVIARQPGDSPESIVDETARYANPRPLRSGVTGRVFIACLPESVQLSLLGCDAPGTEIVAALRRIRASGYGYSAAADITLGGVLTAAVCGADGWPLAALCTFGRSDLLSDDRHGNLGRFMADAARRLADASTADHRWLRASAERLCVESGSWQPPASPPGDT